MGTVEQDAAASEEWEAECSDEEKYNPTGQCTGTWEPAPGDIRQMYEALARGEVLALEWKCPARRSPTPERREEDMEVKEEEELPQEEEKLPPTEFDFDESLAEPSNPITPRRTPGSAKTPRTVQRRVARLDKIMDDIKRHKKLNEEVTPTRPRTPKEKKDVAPSSQKDNVAASEISTPTRSPSSSRMSPKKLS